MTLELYKWLHEAHFYRGLIIDSTIGLERSMDLFIAKYFTDNNKAVELIEILISERMEFSKKADAFIQILRKRCKEEGKNFNKTFPKIAKDFQDIASDRNVFAHKRIYTPDDTNINTNVIILWNFKDEIKPVHYTKEQIDTITDRIQKYIQLINDLTDTGILSG